MGKLSFQFILFKTIVVTLKEPVVCIKRDSIDVVGPIESQSILHNHLNFKRHFVPQF